MVWNLVLKAFLSFGKLSQSFLKAIAFKLIPIPPVPLFMFISQNVFKNYSQRQQNLFRTNKTFPKPKRQVPSSTRRLRKSFSMLVHKF